ncbi:unnamed protein product [Ilex paraguariensis]|uniref:Uncharacterized protein n=1 Tax=Ilex paraguariensis TaxID=185542 RepID=A0ABC8SPG0_9AQUA
MVLNYSTEADNTKTARRKPKSTIHVESNNYQKMKLAKLKFTTSFPSILSIESEFLTSKVGEPTKWSRKVISNMISHICIPFLLKRINWEGQQIHQVMSRAVLDDEDDIVECFLQFLCCIRTDPYNEERKMLPVNLNIEKHITLPEGEFERRVSKYDEQKSLDGEFERKYKDAISQSRPEIFGGVMLFQS